MAESLWSQLENFIGGESLKPSCCYDQPARKYNQVVDIDTWLRNATVEDWKKYLLQGPVSSEPLCEETARVQNTVNIMPTKSHGSYVPFSNTLDGGFVPVVRRKRKRTMFSTEQIAALEKVFNVRPYVTRELKHDLEKELQVSEKAITVWFRNRRLKEKKEKEEQAYNPTQPASHPLEYVESQLHKADRFGFVTLDDRAISDLVIAIDDILPKDIDLNTLKTETRSAVSESECSVMYEPISPPDVTDGSCTDAPFQNCTKFDFIEPGKALEMLFDAHKL